MKFKNKALIFGGLLASGISITVLIGCGGGSSQNNGYTVTYHATAGHKINGKENYSATNIKNVQLEPTPDYHQGEKFVGWYNNASYSGYQVTFPLTVTSNTELYAKWLPDTSGAYNVSFDSNGGSSVPTYLLKAGDSIENTPSSSKSGSKLLGWKASASSDLVEFPFTPTKDTSLVAVWEKTHHKALLHTKGSQPENTNEYSQNVYVTKDENRTIQTAPHTTYANHTFAGWYNNKECEGNPVQFPYELKEENEILYAKFEPNKQVKVTLYDEEDGVEVKKVLENCSSVPYAPAPITTNNTKKFIGWATTKGGAAITDYSPYIEFDSDKEFFAVWSDKDKCTISFCDTDKTPKQTEVYCKEDNILEAPDFDWLARDYYDFYGWYDVDNPETKIEFPIYSIDKNYKVFAKCKRSSFDVEIRDSEFDGKTDEVIIKSYSKKSSITLPSTITSPDPERVNDYKFKQYYYYDESGEKHILSTDHYTLDLEDAETRLDRDNNKFIIYAEWDDSPGTRNYKITIDYGDGVSDFMKTQYRIFVSDLPDPPEETHRTLIHYKDEEGNIYSGDDQIPSIDEPLRDMTLTAVWRDTQRKLKVNRLNNDYKTYTQEEVTLQSSELSEEQQVIFRYSNINVNTESKPKFSLHSFYIQDPTDTSIENPEFKQLDEEIGSDIEEVWEKWDLEFTDLQITYVDVKDESNVLKTETKTNLYPWQYYYRDIKTVITDYEPVKMELNNKTVTLEEQIDDTCLDLGTTPDNKLKVYVDKKYFTVTYKSQCPAETQQDKVAYHQTKVTYYPPVEPTEVTCKFYGWYYESDCTTAVDYDADLTKDIVVYGKWDFDPVANVSCTFNVGSTQMLAKFSDNTKVKTISRENVINEADFPGAVCDGCIFDGWYDSEIGGNKYTKITSSTSGKTLYAHWIPLSDYLSICLDLGEGGKFTETGSQSILMTIKSGTTWGSLKSSVPDSSYLNGEYTVTNWSLNGTTALADTYAFKEDSQKFLNPIVGEKINTPSSFTTDNWATVCAVAENNDKIRKADGTKYSNGFEALKDKYKTEYQGTEGGKQANTFVGLTRSLGYGGLVVRVIGEGQDHSESSTSSKKRLPLSFEITKLIEVSAFSESSASASSWKDSDIYKKLHSGGSIYNLMPKILKDHFATTYKYTSKNSKVSNTLFIPSGYEIGATTTQIGSESKYTYYGYTNYKQYQFKKIFDMGYCNYWLRNITSPYGTNYPVYMAVDYSEGEATKCYWTEGSTALAERGVAVMFCIGTGYSTSR